MSKRGALDAFFTPNKKAKVEAQPFLALTGTSSIAPQPPPAATASTKVKDGAQQDDLPSEPLTTHTAYPFPVPSLPSTLLNTLSTCPPKSPRHINNLPDLDLLYYEPFLPRPAAKHLFNTLRASLFFYRVTYPIKRGPVETTIRTPRYTTVFGVDETCTFSTPTLPSTQPVLLDARTKTPLDPLLARKKYKVPARPIPALLTSLQRITEAVTGATFNFCLVNYYATGADSISYHSDDERFLGPDPCIASFSLGARRDFLLKHKPRVASTVAADSDGKNGGGGEKDTDKEKEPSLKLPLASGDMILMRGRTQANWLHSIPKRSGKSCEADGGRINITFRKAMVPAGTDNYYRYNVGEGPVYVWDGRRREMIVWDGKGRGVD